MALSPQDRVATVCLPLLQSVAPNTRQYRFSTQNKSSLRFTFPGNRPWPKFVYTVLPCGHSGKVFAGDPAPRFPGKRPNVQSLDLTCNESIQEPLVCCLQFFFGKKDRLELLQFRQRCAILRVEKAGLSAIADAAKQTRPAIRVRATGANSANPSRFIPAYPLTIQQTHSRIFRAFFSKISLPAIGDVSAAFPIAAVSVLLPLSISRPAYSVCSKLEFSATGS